MMTVRTTEIDFQAMEAVLGSSEIRQVVILGAGLDPRAWRLAWPEGTKVFEVDTGSVERVKAQVLGPMKMGASSRAFVQADLSVALQPGAGLADKLAAAGESFVKDIPDPLT
jgi:methyltransferase (TIGR00027 family)